MVVKFNKINRERYTHKIPAAFSCRFYSIATAYSLSPKKTEIVTAFLSFWVGFFCREFKSTAIVPKTRHSSHRPFPYTEFLSHNMGVWLFEFYKILSEMESMNFLTNSPGCLAGHASLPMESPEMSSCPGSQSQETVEAKCEPTTPSPNFPPTLQCESAGEQARVVL